MLREGSNTLRTQYYLESIHPLPHSTLLHSAVVVGSVSSVEAIQNCDLYIFLCFVMLIQNNFKKSYNGHGGHLSNVLLSSRMKDAHFDVVEEGAAGESVVVL